MIAFYRSVQKPREQNINPLTTPKNWAPFNVCPAGAHPPQSRSIVSREGVADRLRAAAFAEIQARDAFIWAAKRVGDVTDPSFKDAPPGLSEAWIALAQEEDKHLGWLLTRLGELGFKPEDRVVSDRLWQSFMLCKKAEEFARFMSNSERRGQEAGEKFHREMLKTDPVSAEIFLKIAIEERAHIELAENYFPVLPNPPSPRAVEDRSDTSVGTGVAIGITSN